MPPPVRLPNVSEPQGHQHQLVYPVTGAEGPRWNAELSTHHHLHNATLVGEHRGYVAESQGRWLALLGWRVPARHLSATLGSARLTSNGLPAATG